MKKGTKFTVILISLVSLLTLSSPAQAGTPLGTDRFVIYNPAGTSEEAASVAYNSQRQEYLVVWQDGGIWGRRIGASGTLLDAAFQISATGSSPDVAYNTSDDEYLVVWQTDADVQGQILSALGAHQGSVLNIAAGYYPPPGVDGWYYDQPAVAYSSTSNRYLVVYRYRDDSGGGSDIVARSYESDGAPEAIQFSVGTYSATQLPEQPDLAYNRSRNEFLVAWQKTAGADIDVYGRRVKMTGGTAAMGSEFFIADLLSVDETAPAVAAIPTVPNQGQYLVAWQSGADIYACSVSWDETVGLWQPLATTGWGEYRPAAAGNESNDEFLVTWTWIPVSTPPAMMQVQARTLALDGTPVDGTTLVGGGQVFDSAVAAGPTGDYLVVFDDNETPGTSSRGIYGRLWGHRVYLPLIIRQ
jgi:hypothetical protein